MAPPRLQCLNSIRAVSRKALSLKATFSTSHVRAVEIPTTNTEREFDLSDISRPVGRIQLPRGKPRRVGRMGSNPEDTTSPKASSARVQRLVEQSFDKKKKYFDDKAAATRTMTEIQQQKLSANLSKQISRRFMPGDVYAPHDLSAVEMAKWKRRGRPMYDAFDALNLNPIDHYRNFSMISEYITPMGRIRHSKETGLRPVNQRRIAKTIRRTIGMGIMPSVHRHPEILQKLLTKSQSQNTGQYR
ncbi:Uncharacterized protein BP5553_05167 [Venustampulla echinocandica]|uniref:Small ribosomal subunit protein bS18m n=1 Tax=Venustampulla echinocandica TaxID=2656787 RepID=A0A370TQD9_9HELO|nr:Uncharacterized protein BP5553_05167 [Venustampulla echinocandica]RDL37734.1 Uncharacterized protein BP5553_05167 [Venustampulla echinocandica]